MEWNWAEVVRAMYCHKIIHDKVLYCTVLYCTALYCNGLSRAAARGAPGDDVTDRRGGKSSAVGRIRKHSFLDRRLDSVFGLATGSPTSCSFFFFIRRFVSTWPTAESRTGLLNECNGMSSNVMYDVLYGNVRILSWNGTYNCTLSSICDCATSSRSARSSFPKEREGINHDPRDTHGREGARDEEEGRRHTNTHAARARRARETERASERGRERRHVMSVMSVVSRERRRTRRRDRRRVAATAPGRGARRERHRERARTEEGRRKKGRRRRDTARGLPCSLAS